MLYPKPYSIYSRGATGRRARVCKEDLKVCKKLRVYIVLGARYIGRLKGVYRDAYKYVGYIVQNFMNV